MREESGEPRCRPEADTWMRWSVPSPAAPLSGVECCDLVDGGAGGAVMRRVAGLPRDETSLAVSKRLG